MDQIDCVVIGAGVVGLAVARELTLRGREVLVLDSGSTIGSGISSRNSEVIHAGIYYPQGSLKARLCVAGRQMLYDYCAQRQLSHQRCGKLIVATQADQVARLQQIQGAARANGADDLEMLNAAQANALEPALSCVAALWSPSTGIIDAHGYMLALQGDLENAGGLVVLNTRIVSAEVTGSGFVLTMADESQLATRMLVNAAGLHAPSVAKRIEGLDVRHVPTAYFAKGNYFALSGRAPFSRLIYPVPETAGLGVHLTLDMGGQAKFGPDVQWVDSPDDFTVDPARGDLFYGEARKYWPALPDGALVPGYAGIRPKISAPGEPAADFLVQGPVQHGVANLVNLFGIESPGLTSSLALGQYAADLLGE